VASVLYRHLDLKRLPQMEIADPRGLVQSQR